MDEPARRALHRFKHGESVQQYRGEFGFIFITLLRTKNAKIRVKFVCDVDGKYGKILDFLSGPLIGLIRCSRGDKTLYRKNIFEVSMSVASGYHSSVILSFGGGSGWLCGNAQSYRYEDSWFESCLWQFADCGLILGKCHPSSFHAQPIPTHHGRYMTTVVEWVII